MISVRVSCDAERRERHFYFDATIDLDPHAMSGACDERFVVFGRPIITLPDGWTSQPFTFGVRLLCATHAEEDREPELDGLDTDAADEEEHSDG